MATVTRKQLERSAGLARLESEEVSVILGELRAGVERSRGALSARGVLDLISSLEERVAALRDALDVPVGLSVEQVAARLGVSQPTVRKWVRVGLLQAAPDRKPVEVSQASVLAIESILQRVGETLPERNRTRALAAYLHDRDLLGQEWATGGIAEYERGELERV